MHPWQKTWTAVRTGTILAANTREYILQRSTLKDISWRTLGGVKMLVLLIVFRNKNAVGSGNFGERRYGLKKFEKREPAKLQHRVVQGVPPHLLANLQRLVISIA
jgi:hypothetical protein